MTKTNATAATATVAAETKTRKPAAKALADQLKAGKGQTELARGVKGREAPQSAKALQDAKPKTTTKADAATQKPESAKTPRVKANRAYKVLRTDCSARPGTWRLHLVSTVLSHKDTDSANAANAKSAFSKNKLDFNYCVANGYIAFV